MSSPAAIDEAGHLQALYDLQILGTEPSPAFDRSRQSAQDIFDTPISPVSLIDSDTQWFKAKCGLDRRSTPRDIAFCNHTIADDGLLMVPDAGEDQRSRAIRS